MGQIADAIAEGRLVPNDRAVVKVLGPADGGSTTGLLVIQEDRGQAELAEVLVVPEGGEWEQLQVGDQVIIQAGGIPGVPSGGVAGTKLEDDIVAVFAREVWAIVE